MWKPGRNRLVNFPRTSSVAPGSPRPVAFLIVAVVLVVVAEALAGCGGSTEAGSRGQGDASADTWLEDAFADTRHDGFADAVSELQGCTGSTDCVVLARCSFDLTLQTCQRCQGLACGRDVECDRSFPCVGGQILIRGCDDDSQCQDIAPFCGQYIAVDNVCVDSDDI